MTIAQLVQMAINLSMALLVLALGLQATWADAISLLRQPGLLLRSLVSMNVLMPILAFLMVVLFNLHPAVKIALLALALSPVPPVLPGKQMKAGGDTTYVAGLLVTMSVLSIVIVPLGIWLIDQPLHLHATVPAGRVMTVVVAGIVLPLLIGLMVRQFAPSLAKRIAHPLSLFATALLVVAFAPVLFTLWPVMRDYGWQRNPYRACYLHDCRRCTWSHTRRARSPKTGPRLRWLPAHVIPAWRWRLPVRRFPRRKPSSLW